MAVASLPSSPAQGLEQNAKRVKRESGDSHDWSVAAMTCFMNVLRSAVDDDVIHKNVARVLSLLSLDDAGEGAAAVMANLSEQTDPRCVYLCVCVCVCVCVCCVYVCVWQLFCCLFLSF